LAGNHLRGSEDERGAVFYNYIEIIEHKKPKFFVAENVPGIISKRNIEEFKERFNKIITFYDFDDAGINAAENLKKQFDIPYINTGSFLKDIADYYFFKGRNACIELIEDNLNKLE